MGKWITSPFIFIGIILIILVVRYSTIKDLTSELPRYSEISSLSLIDSNNNIFNINSVNSKVILVNLIFTNCQGVCPLITSKLVPVYKKYSKNNGDLSILSISIDPSRDTPDELKKFSIKQSANHANWYFLTGEKDIINRFLEKDLRVGSIDDPDLHSQRVTLIDHERFIRGYFDITKGTGLEDLNAAINQLLY